MNEIDLQDLLKNLFYEEEEKVKSVYTFSECGLLTRDNGIVVRFQNGDTFQLTIVQSEYGSDSK